MAQFDGHIPLRGDVCEITLDPSRGNEMKKRRPCLVISDDDFNVATNRCIVIPVSNTQRMFTEPVPVNDFNLSGYFQCDQVYTVDFAARMSILLGHFESYEIYSPVAILNEIIDPV